MIAFVNGTVADLAESSVVVQTGGIGYEIFMPGRSMDRLRIGEDVKLHTYLHVREDAMLLFGFLSKDDLQMFRLLLNVNGIGPKAALGVLSGMPTDDLRFAILSEDIRTLSKIPGIGKKTAQKLILEMKDKISVQDAVEKKLVHQEEASAAGGEFRNGHQEAVEALVALGYSSTDAMRAVKMVTDVDSEDVEGLLKAALKNL